MNDEIRNLAAYPKQRIEARRDEILSRGLRLFDFGTGEPCEPTPAFVREALIGAVPEKSRYSSTQTADELRQAAAAYLRRRFGVSVDPTTEILSTSGSMEAVFHLPLILIDRTSKKNVVVFGEPGYKVFEVSSLFAGAEPHRHRLSEEHDYILRPEDVGADTLRRAAMVILNYPHNPSGQALPGELFESWVRARDEHGFVLVSDEAYCDIYFEDAPRSLLEFGREGCVSLYSLSKRSGMTGYFTGFLAGDPKLVATLNRFRPAMGLTSPIWTQVAATAAWSDDAHVAERLETFAEKRRILLDLFDARGLRVYPGAATLFLWVEVPAGHTDLGYTDFLLDRGILVSPGSFYGAGQERYLRVALAPTVDECRAAAKVWPHH